MWIIFYLKIEQTVKKTSTEVDNEKHHLEVIFKELITKKSQDPNWKVDRICWMLYDYKRFWNIIKFWNIQYSTNTVETAYRDYWEKYHKD